MKLHSSLGMKRFNPTKTSTTFAWLLMQGTNQEKETKKMKIDQIIEAARKHYGTKDVFAYLVGYMSAMLTEEQLNDMLDSYTNDKDMN